MVLLSLMCVCVCVCARAGYRRLRQVLGVYSSGHCAIAKSFSSVNQVNDAQSVSEST